MAAKNTNTKTDDKVEVTDDSITVKSLCEELNAEPKAFRRWLRTQTTDRAGRGGRWTFTPEIAETLKEKYRNRASQNTTEVELIDDDA